MKELAKQLPLPNTQHKSLNWMLKNQLWSATWKLTTSEPVGCTSTFDVDSGAKALCLCLMSLLILMPIAPTSNGFHLPLEWWLFRGTAIGMQLLSAHGAPEHQQECREMPQDEDVPLAVELWNWHLSAFHIKGCLSDYGSTFTELYIVVLGESFCCKWNSKFQLQFEGREGCFCLTTPSSH